MNGKTKRYADLIDGVLELATTGLSSEDYTALLDELKRELVFPKQCPLAAPGIPCTYAHRHHGPHSWEKSERRPMSGSDIIREVASRAWEEMEAREGVGPLGHLKPPLGRSPFCAYDKCDNPPTTPGRYCGVHDDPSKSPGTALDPALATASFDAGRGLFFCVNRSCRYKSVVTTSGTACDPCVKDYDSIDRCITDAERRMADSATREHEHVARMQSGPMLGLSASLDAYRSQAKQEHAHSSDCDDPSNCPTGDAYGNVPSGKSMLLDGPAPTPAQVRHLRNEVLEEAAQDIEALKLIGAHDAARILRNLKGNAT